MVSQSCAWPWSHAQPVAIPSDVRSDNFRLVMLIAAFSQCNEKYYTKNVTCFKVARWCFLPWLEASLSVHSSPRWATSECCNSDDFSYEAAKTSSVRNHSTLHQYYWRSQLSKIQAPLIFARAATWVIPWGTLSWKFVLSLHQRPMKEAVFDIGRAYRAGAQCTASTPNILEFWAPLARSTTLSASVTNHSCISVTDSSSRVTSPTSDVTNYSSNSSWCYCLSGPSGTWRSRTNDSYGSAEGDREAILLLLTIYLVSKEGWADWASAHGTTCHYDQVLEQRPCPIS